MMMIVWWDCSICYEAFQKRMIDVERGSARRFGAG